MHAFTPFLRRYLQSMLFSGSQVSQRSHLPWRICCCRHQARICEWHRVAPRGKFFVNRARVFLHATIITLLSHTRRPGLIRTFGAILASYGVLSIAVSAPFPSHFAMFETCFFTVCLCFHEANLTCLTVRCIRTRMRRRDFLRSKKCGGEAPELHEF